MRTAKNLIGERFGRLTVTARASNGKCGSVRWLCVCDCGNETTVFSVSLKNGGTRSCGCLQKDLASKAHTTHGMFRSPEYKSWASMKHRCSCKEGPHFENYVKRGITVCARWANDFAAFYSDMGPRPTLKHSIDRIDNDGNYEPGNCRWATINQQHNNRRDNKHLVFEGRRMTVTQWAKTIGINASTFEYRLSRGWSLARAITTPVEVRGG